MLQRISKYTATAVVIAMAVVTALALLGDPAQYARILHPIRIGLAMAVAIAFWPATWPVFRGEELRSSNWLGSGIVLLMLALVMSSVVALSGSFLGFLTNIGTPVRFVLNGAMTIAIIMIAVAPMANKATLEITARWAKLGIGTGIVLAIGSFFL